MEANDHHTVDDVHRNEEGQREKEDLQQQVWDALDSFES